MTLLPEYSFRRSYTIVVGGPFDTAKFLFYVIRRARLLMGNGAPIFFANAERVLRIRHDVEFKSDHGETARSVVVDELLLSRHLLLAGAGTTWPKNR